MKVQLDYRTFIGMLPMGFSPSISSFFSTHFLVAIFYTFSLPYTILNLTLITFKLVAFKGGYKNRWDLSSIVFEKWRVLFLQDHDLFHGEFPYDR